MFRLDERLQFPPPELAEDSGLLAVGGDLSVDRLLLAYAEGIFPWYEDGLPILWHSPDPRMALVPRELHVPRSLAKQIRRGLYRVTLDTAFARVIDHCAERPRPGQRGTWITWEMREAYVAVHEAGFAHSVEAWDEDDNLVGGLYGVSLGSSFCGESMFALAPDASKVAFATLVRQLVRWNFTLVDCQVHTEHLARFGATEWPREDYLAALGAAVAVPTRKGAWRLDDE